MRNVFTISSTVSLKLLMSIQSLTKAEKNGEKISADNISYQSFYLLVMGVSIGKNMYTSGTLLLQHNVPGGVNV